MSALGAYGSVGFGEMGGSCQDGIFGPLEGANLAGALQFGWCSQPRRAVVAGLVGNRFDLIKVSRQFVERSPTAEIELKHFQGANARLSSRPDTDQKAGDDRQVDLDAHTVRAVSQ